MNDELWAKIISDIEENPRDLETIPLNRTGRWFHASRNSDGGTIRIDNAKTKRPSCALSQIRLLGKDEFMRMYSIYLRRKKGEQVAQEATRTTRNQVYIYSIFYNCGGI